MSRLVSTQVKIKKKKIARNIFLFANSQRKMSQIQQRRINALFNLQGDYFRLRLDFYRQLQDLQSNYSSEYETILSERRKILDASSHFDKTTLDNRSLVEQAVPFFWLTVLKNVDSFDYFLQPRDEICLKYLVDLRCLVHRQGFSFEFHFHPTNPFFSEKILTKFYFVRIEFDPTNPYRCYDGPEIERCQGCSISWTVGHDLTRRVRQKRRRNKLTNEIRTIEIEEKVSSFFDFFSPPVIPAGGIVEMTDDEQLRLEADIEFALLLKQRVIPRAILYYTGEALPILDGE